jgi:alkylation response protein AidB-like acyl-CoA dehydrogenase
MAGRDMDFAFTSEQEEFRREFRDWLHDNLPDGWLAGERPLPKNREDYAEFLRDWQRTLSEGGWAGIHWPEEYGGRGASLMEQVIYEQEMARVDSPHRVNLVGIDMVGPTLMELGTEAQKERFIPNILNGDEIWCQGFSEPHAGSDVAALRTSAERRDGDFVINGKKVWTSRADTAEWCFLFTRTDDSGTKHEGITALMVDMQQDAITTEPIHQMTDEREFSEVYFDEAVATDEQLVGEVDEGWEVVMTQLSFDHGYTEIFEDDQFFRDVVEYCRETTRDGRPIADDPTVRRRLAELDTRIEAAKLTHIRNVRKQMEADGPRPENSMDRAIGDEIQKDLKTFATDILGAAGARWEDGHEEGAWTTDYLFAYGKWIAGGTGDIQRNMIGETVLGLPSDPKSRHSHVPNREGGDNHEEGEAANWGNT